MARIPRKPGDNKQAPERQTILGSAAARDDTGRQAVVVSTVTLKT